MRTVDNVKWTEAMLETLACNLGDVCGHVRAAQEKYNSGDEGYVQLSFCEHTYRHSALIKFDKGYYECNFILHFSDDEGNNPWPEDVEQYKLNGATFLCGFNKELEFITE